MSKYADDIGTWAVGLDRCMQAAAQVLHDLVARSREGEDFEVCAIVTKAGTTGAADLEQQQQRGRGTRGGGPLNVLHTARHLGFSGDQILTPTSSKDASFVQRVADLAPDLCVTAAYGGLLPQAFLDIPRLGTLNVHPSLLPKYRGAAPVQRALQSGDTEMGVSLVYTVLKMDAGQGPCLQHVVHNRHGSTMVVKNYGASFPQPMSDKLSRCIALQVPFWIRRG